MELMKAKETQKLKIIKALKNNNNHNLNKWVEVELKIYRWTVN